MSGRKSVRPQINVELLEADRQRAVKTIMQVASETTPKKSRAMVSRIFNGRSQSLETLDAVARVLKQDVSRYLISPNPKVKKS